MISKEGKTKMGHRKLGYLNLISMRKVLFENSIISLPSLKSEEGKFCGDYQIGKETTMSHKKVHHLNTSRVLELIHMNLMGPMQVESSSDHGSEFENLNME